MANPSLSAARFEYPASVVFEETGETRKVRGWCSVCIAGSEVYGDGVVSPSGLMHIGMTGGETKCGKDATCDGWWWPS